MPSVKTAAQCTWVQDKEMSGRSNLKCKINVIHENHNNNINTPRIGYSLEFLKSKKSYKNWINKLILS